MLLIKISRLPHGVVFWLGPCPCTSAEVQGHGPGQKTTPVGKRDILIKSIEPVGNYAIRIGFSDGHDTGIFSWNTLYDFGLRQDELMTDYLSRLKNDGANRS